MKAVVFTLGCKVNECESGSFVTGLEALGYEVSTHLGYADLYVVNTCAVTKEAEAKSRQAITRVKKCNPDAKIIVCGCASEKSPRDFAEKDGVVFVTGARQKQRVLQWIEALPAGGIDGFLPVPMNCAYEDMPRSKTQRTRAFIKIQDGCNNFCSYCIIPYLRGRTRSRKLEDCVAEVGLCNSEEAVITGIDISSYNDNGRRLPDLLRALSSMPVRIRLGSLEVGVITDGLLAECKKMPNFAPHFHLSLQSGSTTVLRRMNRHYTREEYVEKCRMIYAAFPNAAITTDIIVGFPGETEEEFKDSLSIIDEVGFASVHAFPYSPREGTNSYKLKDLPYPIKRERMERLNAVKTAAQYRYEDRFIGREVEFVPEEIYEGKTLGYTENYIRLAISSKIERRTRLILTKDMIVRE